MPYIHHLFSVNIIFLKVYLEKENISWLSLICLLVGNYILFQYTDSRLTFMLGTVLIIFSAIMKKSQKFREIVLNRAFIWSFSCVSFIKYIRYIELRLFK